MYQNSLTCTNLNILIINKTALRENQGECHPNLLLILQGGGGKSYEVSMLGSREEDPKVIIRE